MKLTLSALLAAALLAFAACGDDNDEESAGTTGTTDTTAEAGATGATGDDGQTAQSEPCPDADSPPNITEVTSYGADCGAVEDAMAEIGSISTSFKLGDFDCERIEGSELAGTWECKGEAAYFTFEFAD